MTAIMRNAAPTDPIPMPTFAPTSIPLFLVVEVGLGEAEVEDEAEVEAEVVVAVLAEAGVVVAVGVATTRVELAGLTIKMHLLAV